MLMFYLIVETNVMEKLFGYLRNSELKRHCSCIKAHFAIKLLTLNVIILACPISSSAKHLSEGATIKTTFCEEPICEEIINKDTSAACIEIQDTISHNSINYSFKPTQLIVPVSLLAVGITGVYAMHDFNNTIRDRFSGYKKGHSFKADDYIQYSTAIGYLGLGFIPDIRTRSDFRQRLMAGVTAYAIMAIAVNTMKYTFKHPRPGSGARNSFPSGHSATAFTGAELMRIEYGNWIGLAGYSIAVTVGALRIYNDKHWITDVLGGAAIGILSARIGYWLIPLEQKLFRLDKKTKSNNAIAVLPMIGDTNGVNLSLMF